jgi:hypothetical protein
VNSLQIARTLLYAENQNEYEIISFCVCVKKKKGKALPVTGRGGP